MINEIKQLLLGAAGLAGAFLIVLLCFEVLIAIKDIAIVMIN